MTETDIDFTWNGGTIPIVNADSETETLEQKFTQSFW